MLHNFLHNARAILVSSKRSLVAFFWIIGSAIGVLLAICSYSEPDAHLVGMFFEHGGSFVRFIFLIIPFFLVFILNRASRIFGLLLVGMKGLLFSFSYSYICIHFPYASLMMLLLLLLADAVLSVAFVWFVCQDPVFYRTIELRLIISVLAVIIATFLFDVFWIKPILNALVYRL